ncbi:MAG: AbiV family abortive infection protein [Nitrospirae bacterium]|nr:AbiV family abortive infection protein [Nitrospirota bacterium]
MKTGLEIDKNRLSRGMSACVENGERLHQDAEWLGTDRSATIVALCILAQEEFAKAFLLHLVCEGIVPWTDKVRESLRNHRHKQLLGIIMEWLSPSHDEFIARIRMKPGDATLPAHVADAMKLYVEKVQPQGHISCPPAPSDLIVKSVADGDRDKKKQDALYVRLSENGEVISVPTQVTAEMVDEELERTKRLSDLVRPLRGGALAPVLDYDLMVETLSFLLLDKRHRPFLLLKGSAFGGPISSQTGTSWPHSIEVIIENISYEQATRISGDAMVFIDREVVRPYFRFNQFALDPCAANRYRLFVSEELYGRAMLPSHKFEIYINLEYHGITTLPKYHSKAWITYDPGTAGFREKLTHVQESVNGGDQCQGPNITSGSTGA